MRPSRLVMFVLKLIIITMLKLLAAEAFFISIPPSHTFTHLHANDDGAD